VIFNDSVALTLIDMQQYVKVVRLERSWALWKEQNEAFPMVPPAGQADKLKALKPRVKAENVPKWAQRSQEHMGIWVGSKRWGRKASDGM
jgi:hypothetical protein